MFKTFEIRILSYHTHLGYEMALEMNKIVLL